MNQGEWERVKELFERTREMPVEEQAAFLESECSTEPALRQQVERLLAAYDTDFMEESILPKAMDQLASSHFQPSQVIGRYRIGDLIGTGGMGQVFRAEDTELDRPVAFKVLHGDIAENDERVRRFIQEAKAASALNHPNILTIHEIGSFEGARFIVSEYVDGETLRERMRGGLTSAESLEIMCQIAAALQAAHAAGIVHRDIKPENIMMRQDGLVKVLDFGLAKLTQADDHLQEVRNADRGFRSEETDSLAWHLSNNPQSEIRNPHLTAPGLIMGTVAYMSPEQARGQAVDSRTDLWSLGVVFHEMLTGESPFKGESVTDLVTSILEHDPDSLDLNSISQELKPICTKALAKDKEARYQTAQDLLQDLQGEKKRMEYAIQPTPYITVSSTDEMKTQLIRPRPTLSAEYLVTTVKRHKYATLLAVALVLTFGIGLSVYKYNGATPMNSEQSFALIDPSTTEKDLKFSKLPISGRASETAISRDGKFVVYLPPEGDKLTVMELSTLVETDILHEKGIWWPEFSPDGKFVYYSYNIDPKTDGIKRVSIQGGSPQEVTKDIANAVSFSPDGSEMVFTRNLNGGASGQQIVLAKSNGSNERTITTLSPENHIVFGEIVPVFSPDGKMLACTMHFRDDGGSFLKIVGVSVADGTQQVISETRWQDIRGAVWLRNGNLVITAKVKGSDPSQIWVISPGNEPRAITNGLIGYEGLRATREGDVLLTMQHSQNTDLWVLPNNDWSKARQLATSGEFKNLYAWMPDGRIVTGSGDIWVMQPDGSGRTKLTHSEAGSDEAAVSADGKHIAFRSDPLNGMPYISRMDADGNNVKQLTSREPAMFSTFSPDGKWVYFIEGYMPPWKTIRKVSIDGGDSAVVVVAPDDWGFVGLDINRADGRLVYGLQRWVGAWQQKIGIVPASGGTPKLMDLPANLTSHRPRWTADNHSVAVRSMDANPSQSVDIWTIPVDGKGSPRQLTDFKTGGTGNFAWSRDGKQLLVSRGTARAEPVMIRNVGN